MSIFHCERRYCSLFNNSIINKLKTCGITTAEGKAHINCHTEFERQLSNLFWYKSNGSSKLKNKAGLCSRMDEHKFVQKKKQKQLDILNSNTL